MLDMAERAPKEPLVLCIKYCFQVIKRIEITAVSSDYTELMAVISISDEWLDSAAYSFQKIPVSAEIACSQNRKDV